MTPEIIALIIQIPLVGVVVGTGWLIFRAINIRDDKWQQHISNENKLQREFHGKQNEIIIEVLKQLTQSHHELSELLIKHDATVRGKNDDVMGTTKEILGREPL